MGLLGVLRLIFVDTWLRWHVFLTKLDFDRVAGSNHRFGRHIDTVGPHVGNVTGFIQALRNRHCLLGTHAKFAGCFLLQRRRHERRRRISGTRFRLNRFYDEIAGRNRLHGQFCLRLVFNREFIKLITR